MVVFQPDSRVHSLSRQANCVSSFTMALAMALESLDDVLVLTKANSRSHVIRRSYLDYLGVNDFRIRDGLSLRFGGSLVGSGSGLVGVFIGGGRTRCCAGRTPGRIQGGEETQDQRRTADHVHVIGLDLRRQVIDEIHIGVEELVPDQLLDAGDHRGHAADLAVDLAGGRVGLHAGSDQL